MTSEDYMQNRIEKHVSYNITDFIKLEGTALEICGTILYQSQLVHDLWPLSQLTRRPTIDMTDRDVVYLTYSRWETEDEYTRRVNLENLAQLDGETL